MPSSFTEIINDYFYGVVGILRKRAKYRCEKRGQDFDQYVTHVKDEQRKIGKPLFEERMRFEMTKPGLISRIAKDGSQWGEGYLSVPIILEWAKRKRSKYRRLEK